MIFEKVGLLESTLGLNEVKKVEPHNGLASLQEEEETQSFLFLMGMY